MPHLAHLLHATSEKLASKPALHYFKDGGWQAYNWQEVWQRVLSLSQQLSRLGVKAGERVALWSENRPEWLIADLAVQTLNAISVPIYVTLGGNEICYILKDSQTKVLIVSDPACLQTIADQYDSLKDLQVVIHIDPAQYAPQVAHLKLVDLATKRAPAEYASEVHKRIKESSEDLTATIIYTSGTTGFPKGVMLSHKNFITNIEAVQKTINLNEGDVHLSFLPLSHVFERLCGQFIMMRNGAQTYYAQSFDLVGENIKAVHPTILLAVPRFYEKIQAAVLAKIEVASPLKKSIFNWALKLGERISNLKAEGKSIPFHLKCLALLANTLVYRKVKSQLGGRIRFCVSGGAPLKASIARFFHSLDIFIVEGYGLTETAPVIAVNSPDNFRFGTVGKPLACVQVKTGPDAEILTKSACVMQGYFNKPEETQAVMRHGWFCTGDLGELDSDGFLTITGRKKELIITSGGKKVCPDQVEPIFEADPAVLRCVLYGEGKNFLTALIIPDFEYVRKETKTQKSSSKDLIHSEAVRKTIQAAVDRGNAKLAPFQQIKYFELLERDMTLEGGELTPTLKLRRSVVLEKYAACLNKHYGPPEAQ